jgi:FK506-binding nuclear protein
MAAIDPDAMPEFEDEASSNKPPRATLKIVRPPPGLDLDEESDEDEEYESEDEDESDDESNGGPSDPARLKKAKLAAAMKDLEDGMDEDEDDDDEADEEDLKSAISKLIKGKGKAMDDDEGSESSDGLELEEVVVCTLDPEKVCFDNSCCPALRFNPSINWLFLPATALPANPRLHRR